MTRSCCHSSPLLLQGSLLKQLHRQDSFVKDLTSQLSTLGSLVPGSKALDSEICALPQHVLQVGAHTQDLLALERGEHTGQWHYTETLASCA